MPQNPQDSDWLPFDPDEDDWKPFIPPQSFKVPDYRVNQQFTDPFEQQTSRFSDPLLQPRQPTQQSFWDDPIMNSWNAVKKPLTTYPSQVANRFAEFFDPTNVDSTKGPRVGDLPFDAIPGGGLMKLLPESIKQGSARALVAGAAQGLGDTVSDVTSPLSLALAAGTGGASIAEKAGYSALARELSIGARLLSAPVAAEGAQETYEADTWGKVGMGIAKTAGGLAGVLSPLRSGPKLDRPIALSKPELGPPVMDAQFTSSSPGGSAGPNPNMPRKIIFDGEMPSKAQIKNYRDAGYVSGPITSEGHPTFVLPGEVTSQTNINSSGSTTVTGNKDVQKVASDFFNQNTGEGNPEQTGAVPYSGNPLFKDHYERQARLAAGSAGVADPTISESAPIPVPNTEPSPQVTPSGDNKITLHRTNGQFYSDLEPVPGTGALDSFRFENTPDGVLEAAKFFKVLPKTIRKTMRRFGVEPVQQPVDVVATDDVPDTEQVDFNPGESIATTPMDAILNSPNQKPHVRSETGIDGNTRLWIDNIEYTDYWGKGGPTDLEIRKINNIINDPQSYRRLAELKEQAPKHVGSGKTTLGASRIKTIDPTTRPWETAVAEDGGVKPTAEVSSSLIARLTPELLANPQMDIVAAAKGELLKLRTTFGPNSAEYAKAASEMPKIRELAGIIDNTSGVSNEFSPDMPDRRARPRFSKDAIQPEILPSDADISRDVEDNNRRTPEAMGVIRRNALARATDDEILQAVEIIRKQAQSNNFVLSQQNKIDLPILQMEVKRRGLNVSTPTVSSDPRPYKTKNVSPMTPEIKTQIREHQAVVKNMGFDQLFDEIGRLSQKETDEGLTLLEKGQQANVVNELKRKDQGVDVKNQYLDDEDGYEPDPDVSNMKVPGINPKTGTHNIAMGGADPRVLDVLGTALYSRNRPSTVAKELLQNSIDEMKISKSNEPVRIVFRHDAAHPTKGTKATSIIMKDFGRGMNAEQLYTVFSDVGKTGKGGEVGASGGFGFAKAAPFLSGDWMEVESIVREDGELVKYDFGGDPKQFKNQTVGVPLNREVLDDDGTVKTGFKVEVFFPDGTSFYDAKNLINQTVKNSPEVKNVQTFEDYSEPPLKSNNFLDEGKSGAPHTDSNYVKELGGQPIPTYQATINTPENDLQIHYDLDDKLRKKINIAVLNNGLYALSDDISVSQPSPFLPEKLVVNINSKVEEGEEGYPFTANRENLNRGVQNNIHQWIRDNIIDNAEKMRKAELQQVFDGLQPATGNNFVTLDSGGRYTPRELANFNHSPIIKHVAGVMGDMLYEMGNMFNDALGTTVKHGFQISEIGKGGINIPSPNDPGKYAVLMNPFGAVAQTTTPNEAAQRMVHIIMHEFNHNRVRSEGGAYTWALSQLYAKFDLEKQLGARNAILSKITDPTTGNYAPEFQKLLQEYTDSRGRPETTPDLLGRERDSEYIREPEGPEGVSRSDQPNGERIAAFNKLNAEVDAERQAQVDKDISTGLYTNLASGGLGGKPPIPPDVVDSLLGGEGSFDPKKPITEDQLREEVIRREHANDPKAGALRQLYELPRGLMSVDLPFITSAAMRQGLPLIATNAWWKAWGTAARAYGSEETFRKTMERIENHPLVKRPLTFDAAGRPRLGKSYVDKIGLRMTDLKHLTNREEHIRSELAEKIPIYGRHIRASNRAYTAFLNELRINTLDNLIQSAEATMRDGKKLDPINNTELGMNIAEVINDYTGRSSLKLRGPSGKEHSAEGANKVLSMVMWSPRMFFGKLRMLNPMTYTNIDPFARKHALYGLLRTTGAVLGFNALLYVLGAKITDEMTNSDFMKSRFKNTRFDFGKGQLQLLTLVSRFFANGATSSANKISQTPKFHPYGKGYKPDTFKEALFRFIESQLHPSISYGLDYMDRTEAKPFRPVDRTLQMTFPLFSQDFGEVLNEHPDLALVYGSAVAGSIGVGAQTYDKDDYAAPKLLPLLKLIGENPKKYDWEIH